MKNWFCFAVIVCMLAGCQMLRTDKPQAIADPSTLPQAEEYFGSELPDFEQSKVIEFREDNKTRAPGGIVFCGDSITAGFPFEEVLPDVPIANRGIGGDSIWGLLRRLDVSAYELRPRTLFLMIGINDVFINKMSPGEYAELYDYLLSQLQENCPDCRIYVQSLLPVRGRIANIESADLNTMVLNVNRELEAVARKHHVKFIDLHPAFCDEKGELKTEYSDDGVHPNRAGYALWARLVARPLAR